MGIGEFIVLLALICGSYLIADKILKLIRWKMEYDMSIRKSMDEIDAYITEDDLRD